MLDWFGMDWFSGLNRGFYKSLCCLKHYKLCGCLLERITMLNMLKNITRMRLNIDLTASKNDKVV